MGKIEKTFWWLCFILAIYTTIGFKLIPNILKEQLIKNLDENFTQKSSIEKIEFNPYTLKTVIYGYKLGDNTPIISIQKLLLDFGLIRSLTDSHINIQEIKLSNLFMDIIEKNGEINLLKLLKQQKSPKTEKKNSSNIKFLISKIIIENSKIDFSKENYKLTFNNINYDLRDFGTYKNSLSSNDLKLKINNTTNLAISGAFRLEPFKMYGKVDLKDLKLREFLNYDKSSLNFDINKEANLNLLLNYNINLEKNSDIKLSSEVLNLNNLSLIQNNSNIAKIDKFSIADFNFDLEKQSIKINNPQVSNLNISMINDKNGINFANLVKISSKKEDKKSQKPWDIKLVNTKLVNTNFTFTDSINSMNIKANNFDTNISKISIEGSKISVLKLNSLYPQVTYLADSLNLNLKDTNTSFEKLDLNNKKIDISNIFLKNKNLNLVEKSSNLLINSSNNQIKNSNFNMLDSNITLDNPNIQIEKISLLQDNLKLETKDTNIDLNNLKIANSNLNINSIKLNNANLLLDNDLKVLVDNINLNLVDFSNTKNSFKITQTTLNEPKITITLPKNKQESSTKTKEETKEASNSNKKINIGPINIQNATLNFEDKNLPLPFKTTISKLNGDISEFKNSKSSNSKLELKGVVDKYGTTKITGIVNPNSIKVLTDINMIFKNISMSNFTPYSGKFIGRELKGGKLDLDLKYNILKSNLEAKNNVTITKLELGDKVESKDAVSLPLDLAITLLEDRSGVIDLNLPISGNIDDPQFSIAPIVWKAFTNLITKAITAPFSLLGAVFGFDENDIKNVKFDFAQSEITPIQQETLDKISQILSKRPNLSIEIQGTYNKLKDLEVLQKEKSNKSEDKKISEKEFKEFEKKLTELAQKRVENIKTYLIKEKAIKTSQIKINKEIKIIEDSENMVNIELKISK